MTTTVTIPSKTVNRKYGCTENHVDGKSAKSRDIWTWSPLVEEDGG